MPQRGRRAGADLHVVPGPQPAEVLAGQGQLADQLGAARVIGRGPDGGPEPGHHGGQHPRQRLEHLDRRMAVAALLKPQVVVRADAGERGDLLAAQPGDAPQPGDPHPDVIRVDQFAAGAQVLTQRVRVVHAFTVVA
jgi:hypothetical protein